MNKMVKILPWMACIAAGCATNEVAQQTAAQEAAPVVEQAPVEPVYVAQVNTVATAAPIAMVRHAAYKQVVLDASMAQWVAVQDIRKSKTNDGYDRVQVLVKNLTTSQIRTQYRFDWQDAEGVVVVDPDHDGWEKLTLVPGDDGVFTSIAPRKNCADFRLRMKNIQ